MKKLKKLFAVFSALAMLCMSFPVIAEDGDLSVMVYDYKAINPNLFWQYGENLEITRFQSEKNSRQGIYQWLRYEGIVVITDSETVLTSESLGLDCSVESFCDSSYTKSFIKDYNNTISDPVTIPDNANTYFIDSNYVMSRDEAENYCWKLLENENILAAAIAIGEYRDSEYLYSADVKFHFDFEGENKIEENSELSEYLKSIGYESDSFAEDENGYYVSFDFKTISEVWEITERLEQFENIKNVIYNCFVTDGVTTPVVYFDFSYLNELPEDNEPVQIAPVTTAPVTTTTTTTTTAPATTTVPVTSVPVILMGDVSGDGEVDIYDAIEIAKYIMDISEYRSDEMLTADYNNDGITNIYDAIEIAKAII